MRIKVVGTASGKIKELTYTSHELNKDLLTWLKENEFNIASSCDGEGICKKCVIQNDWATCQLTLKDFLQHQPDGVIYISYL